MKGHGCVGHVSSTRGHGWVVGREWLGYEWKKLSLVTEGLEYHAEVFGSFSLCKNPMVERKLGKIFKQVNKFPCTYSLTFYYY